METASHQKEKSSPSEVHPLPIEQNADQMKDLREYISQKILSLLNQIVKRAGKIKDKKSEEALHGMRVTTRLLRETLSLFAFYYPPARIESVLGRIKKITRWLGLPREMGVNISFLEHASKLSCVIIGLTVWRNLNNTITFWAICVL